MKSLVLPTQFSAASGFVHPLQARIWFDFSWVRRQKWMGGMKLGPIVYEKKGKSKSNNGPFVGTIRLKVPGTYKQSWKLLKMKNGHHFLV